MRTQVALRNLYISQVIILSFLVFAYNIWFPHSFWKLGGFSNTAAMLVFADLVLGPLLVFIIFKEGKKYLKFDINVLLAIQIGAFAFGAYSLFLKHPAYAVFTGDRFSLTNVSAIYPKKSFLEGLENYFFSSPKLVIATLPKDIKTQSHLMLNIVFNQAPDIDQRPKYYKPLNHQDFRALISKSIPIDNLLHSHEEELKDFSIKYNAKIGDFAYFPLSGNNKKDMVWVFNKQTSKPIGIIDINPWLISVPKVAMVKNKVTSLITPIP